MKKFPALINFNKEIEQFESVSIRFNSLGEAEPELSTEIYLDDVTDKNGIKYQYIVNIEDEFFDKALWGQKFRVIQNGEVIGHAVSSRT